MCKSPVARAKYVRNSRIPEKRCRITKTGEKYSSLKDFIRGRTTLPNDRAGTCRIQPTATHQFRPVPADRVRIDSPGGQRVHRFFAMNFRNTVTTLCASLQILEIFGIKSVFQFGFAPRQSLPSQKQTPLYLFLAPCDPHNTVQTNPSKFELRIPIPITSALELVSFRLID